ncbi:MAG TPA: hypothetical protein PLL30_12445 [Candidatus Krumholzibacteria bacterium]|nr:hypothetical protein [Candidatus Krumholzibacteria bacterium]HPD72578.1 hypothetical protein [Candidatus Krumholzibacteria bacterium]HRY40490.1 hypothetical protein [Candidatus Krumholzibacteria bacterium]
MLVTWTADVQWRFALLLAAGQLLAATVLLPARPRPLRAFLARGVVACAIQVLVLVPLLGPATLALAVAAFAGQRAASWLLNRGAEANVRRVAIDYGVQLAVLVAAWAIAVGAPRTVWLPRGHWLALGPWTTAAGVLAVCGFTWSGGATLTALVLRGFPNLPASGAEARMGRTIGILERTLVLLMVAFDQWGAVGLVVAAKSLARFKALDRRHYAEYYLIGTLTSLLIACLAGLALKFLLDL